MNAVIAFPSAGSRPLDCAPSRRALRGALQNRMRIVKDLDVVMIFTEEITKHYVLRVSSYQTSSACPIVTSEYLE